MAFFNSLSQTLLKLTAPGVPDTYQGAELWDLSMVDPDNRRPVDFERRGQMLNNLRQNLKSYASADLLPTMLEQSANGLIKLFTTHVALEFRRQHRLLFERGDFEALTVGGKRERHVCAYARSFNHDRIVTAVPRLVYSLTDGKQVPPIGKEIWEDTWISLPSWNSGDRLCNEFTKEHIALESQNGVPGISLSAALAKFPVALLSKV